MGEGEIFDQKCIEMDTIESPRGPYKIYKKKNGFFAIAREGGRSAGREVGRGVEGGRRSSPLAPPPEF